MASARHSNPKRQRGRAPNRSRFGLLFFFRIFRMFGMRCRRPTLVMPLSPCNIGILKMALLGNLRRFSKIGGTGMYSRAAGGKMWRSPLHSCLNSWDLKPSKVKDRLVYRLVQSDEVHAVNSIGSYAAKTHLPELLERVERGERILITRRGRAVAMLVPCESRSPKDVRRVIHEFKEFSRRQGRTLGRLTIRQMIEEGRRS